MPSLSSTAATVTTSVSSSKVSSVVTPTPSATIQRSQSAPASASTSLYTPSVTSASSAGLGSSMGSSGVAYAAGGSNASASYTPMSSMYGQGQGQVSQSSYNIPTSNFYGSTYTPQQNIYPSNSSTPQFSPQSFLSNLAGDGTGFHPE
jgi:hypothetical protein